jgi:hypothetical protein
MTKRGLSYTSCNAIGALGDDLQGIQRAMNCLQRVEKNND